MAVPAMVGRGGGRLHDAVGDLRPGILQLAGAASIATLLMTLFIQRSEHRDTQAIHAKLDELLRSQRGAEEGLATLDDKEPEQIEAFRKKARAKR